MLKFARDSIRSSGNKQRVFWGNTQSIFGLRLLFVATMAIASIAMAVMMAKGFGWIH